jgi:hypothetical protein
MAPREVTLVRKDVWTGGICKISPEDSSLAVQIWLNGGVESGTTAQTSLPLDSPDFRDLMASDIIVTPGLP